MCWKWVQIIISSLWKQFKAIQEQTDAHLPMEIEITINLQGEVEELGDFDLVLRLDLNQNFIILQNQIVGLDQNQFRLYTLSPWKINMYVLGLWTFVYG